MSQDPFHCMMRFFKDNLFSKDDPEKSYLLKHFRWIFKGVSQQYTPTILNGKYTAQDWYKKWFKSKYFRLLKQVENNLAVFISKVLHHRRHWNADVLNKNESVLTIKKLQGYANSEYILTHLFINVAPAHWTSLLSRWGWIDGKVFTLWFSKTIKCNVYKTEQDYHIHNI